MRRLLLAVAVLAAGCHPERPADPAPANDPQADVRRELEARYAENEAGFFARDADRVMRLRHPDFHTITPDGSVNTREQMYERTRAFIGRVERFDSLTETIRGLTLVGDTAHATVDQRTTRQQRFPDGALHEVRTSVVQRESWIRTPDGWMMWRVDGIQPGETVVDGRPIGGDPAPASQPEGFLATPRAGTGPGVLVLHPWWGLNDTMRQLCTRLAGEGFVAFAPDLYRGRVAATIEQAESLSTALDAGQARADVARAVDFLSARAADGDRGLAVVGFSMGAYFALDVSAARPERISKVVIFYGVGPADFGRSRAEYLGHFADQDTYEPEENIRSTEASLRKAGRPVTFHRYPGAGHWFFEPDRKDAYDEAAAKLAWERTRAFLKAPAQAAR